ncbi:MAG: methyltransferase [Bacteroidota bacterium]
MANDFFQFKQFRIDQGQCAMKVTTDGCLFGALIALSGVERGILDIGTGTGLLSLMLAQRSSASITALEIDPKAANQASLNFASSPWQARLQVRSQSLQTFSIDEGEEYFDTIVSNPPFFQNHRRSGTAKDVAIHDDTLPQADLANAVERHLAPEGCFWVIYPDHQFLQFHQQMVDRGWACTNETRIRNRPGEAIFRRVGAFRRVDSPTSVSEIVIRNHKGQYADAFQDLMDPYYL